MNLRTLRASGNFATVSVPEGTWVRYGPGELARCPANGCGRGLLQAGELTVISVRVARDTIIVDGPAVFLLCPDGRCKERLEIRLARFLNGSG